MYLTQKSRSLLVGAAGCALSIALALVFLKLFDPTWDHMVRFGNSSVDIRIITLALAKLVFVTAYVLFVIQGFRTHWGWGLANLVMPVAALVFLFVHPRAARIPAIIWTLAFTVLLITLPGIEKVPLPAAS